MTVPYDLAIWRQKAVNLRPYLSAAIFGLLPVETEGLGTLSVDKHWRLYYDPAVFKRWKKDQGAGVLIHEISHLLREHPARMESLPDHATANLATDAELSDDLVAEKVALPPGYVLPSTFGEPDGLLAEEYYARLKKKFQRQSQGGAGNPKVASADDGDGSTSQGGHPDGSSRESDRIRQAPGQSAGPLPSIRQAPGGDNGPLPSDPDPSGCSPQAGSFPDSPGTSRPSQTGAEPKPKPGGGSCGSAATGHRAPWEQGDPSEDQPGKTEAEAEITRSQVAEAIISHAKQAGRVPSEWLQWARARQEPSKINWRRELAANIRRTISDAAGMVDFTYAKPSRREEGAIIFPAMRKPTPKVAIIADTSGSMNDVLDTLLTEVKGILKAACAVDGVPVLATDAEVHAVNRVFKAEQVSLIGGGGTDMRVGIEAALRLKPKPDTLIVLTDAWTPWPRDKPKGVRVVVGQIGRGGDVPAWARKVEIEE